MLRYLPLTVFQLLLLAQVAGAQPLFTDVFPPEEFAARRARVTEHIGDGIVVLQGAGEISRVQLPGGGIRRREPLGVHPARAGRHREADGRAWPFSSREK